MDAVRPGTPACVGVSATRPRMRAGRLANAVAWSALAAACAAFPAVAQQADTVDEATAVASGARIFEAGYFRQYNPVTAADMVSRVPGFEINDGESRRGFGSTAGNVLVNGERPSSKVAISDQLKRISADSVARLELISGAADVDVRGQTQLVNVVLKAGGRSASPATWVLDARHIQYSNRIGWTTQITKSFALGDNAELSLDFQAPNLRGRSESYEAVLDGSGVLTGYRLQNGQPNNIGLQGAAGLKWRPTARDSVSLNLQVAPTWNTTGVSVLAYSPSDDLQRAIFGRTEYTDNTTTEVGGDWEHRFSSDLSVKALALAVFSGVDQEDVFRTYSPSALLSTRTQQRATEAGERVGRGVLTWRASSAHTLELGAEGAFNFRDTTFDIFNDTGSGPVVVALPGSDARVEEVRGEAFVSDVWKASDALTIEAGVTFEASRITQTGDEEKEREFTYTKPRVIATWQAGSQDQVRASLVREVAQLDFGEFASSVNFTDSSSLIGNADLEPEKTWKARAEWERRFGARGALTLAVFHEAVEDVQDFIPLRGCLGGGVLATCAPANLRLFDAPGNIGDGTRTGIEVRGAAPLGPIGIPGADLRFSGTWQETQVTDPATGEERSFSGEKDWNYSVSFRQDLSALKSAWGVSASRSGSRMEYRVAEDNLYDRPDDRLDFYVETTAVKGITLRFSASNLLSPPEERVRTFYADSDPTDLVPARALGVVSGTDIRETKGGPEGTLVYSIRASGSF